MRRFWAVLVGSLVGLLALSAFTVPVASAAGDIQEVTGFGSNPGNLRMLRAVPDGLAANRPVVVALHGCGQTATAYGTESGWLGLANQRGFTLLLPEQQLGNNLAGCFNWFNPDDVTANSGEAASIAQMIDRTIADTGADPSRVYVTGLSAGAAMTNALLASYPDRFAGAAPVAGVPYGCAGAEGALCQAPGVDKTPAEWGDLVRAAGGSTHANVAVWQGNLDNVVSPIDEQETVDEWTNVRGVVADPTGTDTVGGFPHATYGSAVESYTIVGMGHGQPVDPASGCGIAAPFMYPVGLCAAARMADTWGL